MDCESMCVHFQVLCLYPHMTSHISHHSKSESYDSTRTRPLTYVSRPSTLAMNLALGTKAKLAITNSLGRLNQKLRISLFPSPGTYLGVIQNQSAWSASEHHVWVAVLMVGVALLYGSRMGLSLAVTEIARDRNLDNHLVVIGKGLPRVHVTLPPPPTTHPHTCMHAHTYIHIHTHTQ